MKKNQYFRIAALNILLSAIFLLVSSVLAAQSLHMFIICETSDGSIGAVKDHSHMQAFAESIATQSGLTLRKYFYKKNELSETEISGELSSMNVGSDDVVWFYYSGHGFNPEGSSFSAFRIEGTRYTMDWVHNKIQSKNPRLSIIMYDACNWNERGETPVVIASRNNDQFKIAKLFKKASGWVKVASNTAGPRKYSYGSPEVGGMFTNAFLNTFRDCIDEWGTNQVTWKNIMEGTKNLTMQYAQNDNKEQTPFYSVEVSNTELEIDFTPDSGKGTKDPDDH